MENYGSNESKDDKTSTKESSSAKPDTAKAQSLAELLLHNDAAERQHRVIWEREKESEDDDDDSSDGSKPKLLPRIRKAAPSTKDEARTRPSTAESAADSSEENDDKLGELEPDEVRAIAEQYAAGRSAELRDEQAELPADSPEQAAAAANAAMIQKLSEKLRAEPEGDPQQAIAEAADETIANADLGSPDQARAALPPSETQPQDDENEPPETTQQATGSTTPPSPPTPAAGGNPPGGPPRYPGGPSGPGGINPNAAPIPPRSNPNTWGSANITPIEAQYYARQAENRGLLVGGVVGYLLGRRRGRIKTEKRLLPVQKKLEKEVTNLHTSIANREQQIRTLAAEKARARQATQETVPRPSKPEATVPIPRPLEAAVPVERVRAPLPAEQPQHFEAIPIPVPGAEAQPGTSHPEGSPELRVERMKQVELLKATETVIIEGASLRQIYETHRVTERGLRHIMTEYLRGGDVKKALDQELTIKEMSYERDPRMRDSLSAPSRNKPGDGTSNDPSPIQPRQPFGAESTAPAQPANRDDRPTTPPKSAAAPNNLVQGTLIRVWVVFVIVLVVLAAFLLVR